jgi:hypothetical protein
MFRLLFMTLAAIGLYGDTLTLKNGDRLSGEIQDESGGSLTLKTSYAGIVKIDKQMIAQTLRDASAAAKPATKDESAGDDTSGKGLSVEADLAHIYSGRNKASDLSSNLDAQYVGEKHEIFLTVHQAFSRASDSASHNNSQSGRLTYHYYFAEHPFLFSWTTFGHTISSEEEHGLSSQYGGGGGWSFTRSSKARIWAQAGVLYGLASGAAITASPMVNADGKPGENITPYDITGSVFLGGLVGKTKTSKDIELSGQLYYFKPLNGIGHQQLGTDNAIQIPLTGALSFTIRAYATTSVRQPRLFEPKNLVISTGLSLSF